MRIGKAIKVWRTIENYSLRKLAKEIKISAATLSRIENGKEADGATLVKIICFFMRTK